MNAWRVTARTCPSPPEGVQAWLFPRLSQGVASPIARAVSRAGRTWASASSRARAASWVINASRMPRCSSSAAVRRNCDWFVKYSIPRHLTVDLLVQPGRPPVGGDLGDLEVEVVTGVHRVPRRTRPAARSAPPVESASRLPHRSSARLPRRPSAPRARPGRCRARRSPGRTAIAPPSRRWAAGPPGPRRAAGRRASVAVSGSPGAAERAPARTAAGPSGSSSDRICRFSSAYTTWPPEARRSLSVIWSLPLHTLYTSMLP